VVGDVQARVCASLARFRRDPQPPHLARGEGRDAEFPAPGGQAIDRHAPAVRRKRPGRIAFAGPRPKQRTRRSRIAQVKPLQSRACEIGEGVDVEPDSGCVGATVLDHRPPAGGIADHGAEVLPGKHVLKLEGPGAGGRSRRQSRGRGGRHSGCAQRTTPGSAGLWADAAGHYQLLVSCSDTNLPMTSALVASKP
jgi:hypothetical protein